MGVLMILVAALVGQAGDEYQRAEVLRVEVRERNTKNMERKEVSVTAGETVDLVIGRAP